MLNLVRSLVILAALTGSSVFAESYSHLKFQCEAGPTPETYELLMVFSGDTGQLIVKKEDCSTLPEDDVNSCVSLGGMEFGTWNTMNPPKGYKEAYVLSGYEYSDTVEERLKTNSVELPLLLMVLLGENGAEDKFLLLESIYNVFTNQTKTRKSELSCKVL